MNFLVSLFQAADEQARLSLKLLRDNDRPHKVYNSVNLNRLKLEHPDIYEQYVTVSEYRRFTVKSDAEAA